MSWQVVGSGVMELTEEDQMLQAIAMSLGENVQVSGGASGSSEGVGSSSASTITPYIFRCSTPKPPPATLKEMDDEPLSKETLGECGN